MLRTIRRSDVSFSVPKHVLDQFHKQGQITEVMTPLVLLYEFVGVPFHRSFDVLINILEEVFEARELSDQGRRHFRRWFRRSRGEERDEFIPTWKPLFDVLKRGLKLLLDGRRKVIVECGQFVALWDSLAVEKRRVSCPSCFTLLNPHDKEDAMSTASQSAKEVHPEESHC